MAHFAKINENNEVLIVLVVDDCNLLNDNNIEEELIGQKYLEKHHKHPANMWIQTSYNTYNNKHNLGKTPFRGNYAGVGCIWDEQNQIFWPKKPYESWVKDLTTASWKSPIGDAPALTEEENNQNKEGSHGWEYFWNEINQSWDLIDSI
jgi:hypothetical protein